MGGCNSRLLVKYLFRICLCAMLISLSTSHVFSKMVNFLFSAYFSEHFCYHTNCKSQSNMKLLHFGYCSNRLIRKKLVKYNFYILASWGGGAKKPLNARSSLIRNKYFFAVKGKLKEKILLLHLFFLFFHFVGIFSILFYSFIEKIWVSY